MKGLLLKDLYMTKAYCKMYLVMIPIFMAASCFSRESWFILYAIMMIAMIPLTLQSYDEREKWDKTCMLFPVSRTQIVSGKYLFGLISTTIMILLYGAVLAVNMSVKKQFVMEHFITDMYMMLSIGFLEPAIVLPLVFKFGTEKGRISYIVSFVVIFGAIKVAQEMSFTVFPKIGMYGILAIIICVYVFSWVLSIRFYQRRQL